jgi:hypothetical protein
MLNFRANRHLLLGTKLHRTDDALIPQLRYMNVELDYRRVTGIRPSQEDIIARFSDFCPEGVINLLSFLGLVIDDRERVLDERVHAELIPLLFPRTQRSVLAAFQQMSADLGQSKVVLISTRQLLTATKFCLIYSRGSIWPRGDAVQRLGEALLMLNDLSDAEHSAFRSEVVDQDVAMLGAFSAMSTFYHEDDFIKSIARNYVLFLQDQPRLHNHPSYIDLPACCRQKTGIDTLPLWSLTFASMGPWSRDDLPEFGEHFSISIALYREVGIPLAEIKAFLSTIAVDYNILRQSVGERYHPNINSFDASILASHPLIRFGDHFYCPYPWLLRAKLGTGLYHLMLSGFSRGSREAQDFMNYTGAVFEDYVHAQFRTVFPKGSRRYMVIPSDSQRQNVPMCDAAIDYGDAMILLEFKSKLRGIAARAGLDAEASTKWIDDIYVKPMRQILSTVEEIRAGRLPMICDNPSRIRRFLPIIITMESTPLLGPIYDAIDRRIKASTGPCPPQVAKWQCMHVGELESLIPMANVGIEIRAMLLDKIDRAGPAISFMNYWFERQVQKTYGPNPILDETYQRLIEDATQWIQAHSN